MSEIGTRGEGGLDGRASDPNDGASGGGSGELQRWHLRVDALNADAARRCVLLEQALEHARRAVERALRRVSEAQASLDPAAEQTRRIEEVARTSGDAATRTDLLALNFQVEAARLGEDDRGLEKVAHEIRTLADRGARGAAEIDELAESLERAANEARSAWTAGRDSLEEAREELRRAGHAAESAGTAMARARGASAELAAEVSTDRRLVRTGGTQQAVVEAVRRLAAAAEVREAAITRLARASAARLWGMSRALLAGSEEAEEAATTGEGILGRIDELYGLVVDADEIARRAKQLALNADLAATRSEDPAFQLFAEEARRLSEQAEATAANTQSQLEETRAQIGPEVVRSRERSESLSALASELAELLERFGGGRPPEESVQKEDALAHAWRENQAAAAQMSAAQAHWMSLGVTGRAGRPAGPVD